TFQPVKSLPLNSETKPESDCRAGASAAHETSTASNNAIESRFMVILHWIPLPTSSLPSREGVQVIISTPELGAQRLKAADSSMWLLGGAPVVGAKQAEELGARLRTVRRVGPLRILEVGLPQLLDLVLRKRLAELLRVDLVG